MKVFSKVYGAKLFSTRLIFCVIILASLVCFPCLYSVFYDFHCLILCKQTSNMIILKILTAIVQYIFIHKNLQRVLLETRQFLFDLVLLMFMSRHLHNLSFRRILIILLRPLSAHALFEYGRFNKDGQKNKREYINKPERNACKDYLFHK